ncbi:calcium-binding protein, partial [uncultured Thiocystis sp.]|uniref:calcium-binding protein n=1 Tax=uncultured Thiocystis sp. TaxID=1202134 RepID=UPI0025FC7DDE
AAINGTGNALNNVLTGNTAANVLTGGTGNDTYVIDNSGDVVTETSTLATEIDTVNSSITYTLSANVERLTLTGFSAINGTGNSLNNVLTGNSSANTLVGGAGADTLKGDESNDILAGGTEKDVYTLTESVAATDTVRIAAGDSLVASYDVVSSFKLGIGTTSTTGVDQLDLVTTVVAANAASVNGTDSGNIHSHSIFNGLITFDDADAYAAPLTLTAADLPNVFTYLQSNITAGATVEFNALGNTYVFQGGETDDILIQLTGVTSSSLTTTGLADGGLWIV